MDVDAVGVQRERGGVGAALPKSRGMSSEALARPCQLSNTPSLVRRRKMSWPWMQRPAAADAENGAAVDGQAIDRTARAAADASRRPCRRRSTAITPLPASASAQPR